MRTAILILTLSLAAFSADTRLADAAKKDDRKTVHALLEQHVDVNLPQADGTTALHWAAEQDDLDTVQLLLKAGANPNAANRYGMTPLSLACTNGSGAIVELLLAAGADPNAALPGGETPLMTASRTGKVEPVRALLLRKASVEAKDPKGQTAIVWAAAEGNVAVIEELIKAGASFKVRLNSGFTPYLIAVREGRPEAVKAFLKAGVDVNEAIQPPAGSRGAGGGSKAAHIGDTALHLAVGNAHYELASMLLDMGADPNASVPGYTPLHMIPSVRKPGGGDNDPAPDGSGTVTSLEIIKKLAAKGADLNARMTRKINFGLTSLNTVGATAFCLAAKSADGELMRFLAALGADPKIPTADGATPLIVAAGLGTRSPGEDAGTDAEVVEAVAVAIELGNDPNAVDKNGETAMHGAAYKNVGDAVRYLASHGAKPEIWNQPNSHGWTPLTIAEGHRFGNYKPSPPTIAAFLEVMKAAGIEPKSGNKDGISDYKK